MEILIIVLLLFIAAEVSLLLAMQKRRTKRANSKAIFVDTSVLIDGRIVEIAKTGFIGRTLLVPRSVVGELQFLADTADGEKRARARHGLDVARELQHIDAVEVAIFPDSSRAEEGVDERLLNLARQHGGMICTIDYNLNKVAQVEGIGVLNINDLAKSVRMAYLPGEKTKIFLTSKGNDSSQAVGHLEDGTMVVVEQAKAKIGSEVEVEVVRSLQTTAGRMMFAKLVSTSDKKPKTSAAKKPGGKKLLTKTMTAKRSNQKTRPTKTEAKQPKSNTNKDKTSGRKLRQNPRQSNEDRLIALVNQQD